MNRREFLSKAGLGAAAGVIGGAVADSAKASNAEVSPKGRGRYNVILVIADDMKASALACYGNRWAKSPVTDRLSRGGVIFERAYTQFPKCVPSRASIMTSRYPHIEGHRTLPGFMLRPEEPHLATVLRSHGYRTALIGKNHTVEPEYMEASFDHCPKISAGKGHVVGGPRPDEPMFRAFYRGKWMPQTGLEDHHEARIIEAGRRFIRDNAPDRFFLLLSLNYPHTPYVEIAPWAEEYRKTDVPPPPIEPLDSTPRVLRHYRRVYDLESLPRSDWQTIVVSYLSMCSFVDQLIGGLLEELSKQDISDRTLFIFTSDNGDFAGEHGCAEKWDTMFYECLVWMPLLMRLPGVVPEGKRLPQLVELIDIAPTILDICGLPIPDWMMGKSLLPLMRGDTKAHKDAVFSEGGLEAKALASAPHHDSPQAARMKPDYYWKQKVLVEDRSSLARAKMVRTQKYKCIYRVTGEEELFDLLNDPGEIRNVASEARYKGVLDEMRMRLLQWTVETETDRPPLKMLFA